VFFPVVRSEGAKGDGVTGILLLMHRGKPVISYICTPQEVPERVWRCEDTRP